MGNMEEDRMFAMLTERAAAGASWEDAGGRVNLKSMICTNEALYLPYRTKFSRKNFRQTKYFAGQNF